MEEIDCLIYGLSRPATHADFISTVKTALTTAVPSLHFSSARGPACPRRRGN